MIYYLYTICTYLPNCIMNIVTLLVGIFIKRDDKIYLFGSKSGVGFGGNTRNMFLYLAENKEEYDIKKVIFVTRSKKLFRELSELGYDVYKMHSLKSYYYHFKAGKHICSGNIAGGFAAGVYAGSDILSRLSFGADHFYLHHHIGTGKSNMMFKREAIKGFKRLVIESYRFFLSIGFIRHFFMLPGGWDNMTFCVSCKQDLIEQEIFWEHHPIRFVVTCFAELLPTPRYLESEREVVNHFPKGKTLVLYAPVYRTVNTGYINPLLGEGFIQFLEKENYFWIQKLNYQDSQMDADENAYSNPNVMNLPSDFDLNIISSIIDIQVTDYSSTRMKAIALNKPVVYYVPDYDVYSEKDKGIEPMMEEAINNNRADSINDLCNRLLEARDASGFFTSKRIEEYQATRSLQIDCSPLDYTYEHIYKDIFGVV